MFKKRITRESEGSNEVNVTPLIDVSLVLVVILLLATPLAFESSIGVRSAMRSGAAPSDPSDDARVELRLVSEDTVRVNQILVSRADLSETLSPLLDRTGSRKVVVGCVNGVSHGAFVNVLDQAKLCGAGEIAVTGK